MIRSSTHATAYPTAHSINPIKSSWTGRLRRLPVLTRQLLSLVLSALLILQPVMVLGASNIVVDDTGTGVSTPLTGRRWWTLPPPTAGACLITATVISTSTIRRDLEQRQQRQHQLAGWISATPRFSPVAKRH